MFPTSPPAIDSTPIDSTPSLMITGSQGIEFRRILHLSEPYSAAVALRDRLLRAPLGLTFSSEELNAEHSDIHLAGFDAMGTLIACLVLSRKSQPGNLRLRQVAVAPESQGQGVGKKLIHFAESFAAIELHATHLTLHARQEVIKFYERLGYHTVGTPFIEVGIQHIGMEKSLLESGTDSFKRP